MRTISRFAVLVAVGLFYGVTAGADGPGKFDEVGEENPYKKK